MVGGLDGRYRIEADALVGAMQTLIVHAESGGSGDALPREVVPDVGPDLGQDSAVGDGVGF
jgi:hypothetical protein